MDFLAYYWTPNTVFYPILCYPQDFIENQSNQFSIQEPARCPLPANEQLSTPENHLRTLSKPQENQATPQKTLLQQKKKKKEDFAPKSGCKSIAMRKKKYERDADRNILPNIVNKLYSFVGCKSRCKNFVADFLNWNPQLKQHCSVNKFFFYHKELRSSLNKFLLEDDLAHMFKVQKKLLFCFPEEEQKCFIRINIFMLHLYYRNNYHVTSVVNSCRISKTKIEDYLKYFRATK